jgi:hypothetical protein
VVKLAGQIEPMLHKLRAELAEKRLAAAKDKTPAAQ